MACEHWAGTGCPICEIREVLNLAYGIEPGDRVEFVREGQRGVGICWDGPDGGGSASWCCIEPLHNTPAAYETARRKAGVTVAALQNLYGKK